MTSLVFKFRDDLLLTDQLSWVDFLKVPANYFQEAKDFFFNARPHANLHIATTLELGDESDALYYILKSLIDLAPRFLFMDSEVQIINKLWHRLDTYEKSQNQEIDADENEHDPRLVGPPFPPGPLPVRRAPSDMPNLFNYFRVDFPKGYDESELKRLLNELGQFLPHNASLNRHLLEFAYVKDSPIELSGNTFAAAREAISAGGNQAYLHDMGIAENAPPEISADIRLTVIEVDSWDLTHPQFVLSRGKDVIFPASLDVLCISSGSGKLDHGTQILGMLLAKVDESENPNDCRGIVPNLSVRLASCLTNIAFDAYGNIDSNSYSEECAVFVSVLATNAGETILIEMATGSGLPIDVMPAVYELLSIAHRLDITVVSGAGNASAILNRVPEHQSGALMPRDLRAKIVAVDGTVLENHSQSHWNIYERMNDLTEKYASIGARFRSIDDFLRHYQETPSKAILVGATMRKENSTPTGICVVSFSLKPESGRGNRVQVFAQGNSILTTNHGGEFYNNMGDTSGASAIIAGILVLAQSVAKTKGKIIPPDLLARWLTQTPGIASVLGLPGRLTGVVPSYKNLLNQVNLWLSLP